jgi:branched-chain amino acid transport system ATP-binding protein
LGHSVSDETEDRLARVYDYFPRLEERRDQRAGSLSGGERQMVAIGRGLVSNPDLLLIDEPTEGLMPTLVEKLKEILVRINREEEITMLLVEQNVSLSLDISDYAYVIDEGVIQTEGPSDAIAENEEIKRKYLAV